MAARLSLTSSSGEDDHAALPARLQPHGPERGAPKALFGHPQDGTVIILRLVSHDMASKHEEDASSMHATEQVSPQLNGRAALSMNVTKTQPQGLEMSGQMEARGSLPCVQDTNAIERGTTYSSTLPCASLWTEPGAAITNHSNAPPSQAAWMDGPALAAVAVLNFAFHLVWSFFAIVRGMMYVVLEINRLCAEPSVPCTFSGIWLMQPSLSLPRAMHRHAPCTPKSARAVLTGERPPSSMGGLAPCGWHSIMGTVHGVACSVLNRITITVRASQRERPLAPEHPERKRRSSSCGHADLHLGVWLLCPNYDHWTRRAAARFRMVLPIADALWRIMVLSSFRLAVHGSIVAVICAWLSMGLCYAMPQHHRMDHKSLVVCLCCFAHHHVCSTFAMLDEKWARGFALDAVPRPVHRIMHCWRYHSTLAGAGGATAATYQSLSLDATTKDGTRKPSACGSATLLATVLAVTNVVARFCSTLSEHVIHVFNNVWLATVSTMRQGRRKHCTGPSSPMGLVKMLLVVILCFAQNVQARGHAMIDGKNTEDFAREFSEAFDSICQRDDAPGSSISQLIYRACDVMVSKQHDLPMGQEDMFDLRCTRIDSLLHDLWEVANEANVKEGLEFVREVEVLVEKETVCRTPTSSCLANKFRDSRVDAFLLGKTMQECSAGHVEAREGSCEDFQQLRERMDQVVHEYASEKGLVEHIRESTGRLLERAECRAPATHERKLSSSLPICSFQSATEDFYELTESCRLTDQITVGSGKTLTIVGIGAPIIDREQNGRHFYVSGGGHLNVTGVTLANGRVTGDNVSWML